MEQVSAICLAAYESCKFSIWDFRLLRCARGEDETPHNKFNSRQPKVYFFLDFFYMQNFFSGCCGSSKETREFAAVQVQLSRQRRSDAIKEFSTGAGVGAGVFRPLLSSEKNETFKYREENGSLKQLVERESSFSSWTGALCTVQQKNIQTATFFCCSLFLLLLAFIAPQLFVHQLHWQHCIVCLWDSEWSEFFSPASNRILLGISIVQLHTSFVAL